MREHRDEKASAELRDLMAQFIAREAGRTTLITPTRVEFGNNPKFATIFISVFPENETEHAIAFLSRNTTEFRDFLKKNGRFSVLPFVKFLPDYGEQNRRRLDELSTDL
jgi:ribosome-binding factor A